MAAFAKCISAAVLVERMARGCNARHAVANARPALEAARTLRELRHHAACRIQRSVQHIRRMVAERKAKGIVLRRVQSLVRGRRARAGIGLRQTDTKQAAGTRRQNSTTAPRQSLRARLAACRRRVYECNARAAAGTVATLGERTAQALVALSTGPREGVPSFSVCLHAGLELQTTTSLSTVCCSRVGGGAAEAAGALAAALATARACNRSPPHERMVAATLHVLSAVTVGDAAEDAIHALAGAPGCADALATLVQNWREKDELLRLALRVLGRVLKHNINVKACDDDAPLAVLLHGSENVQECRRRLLGTQRALSRKAVAGSASMKAFERILVVLK